MSVEVTPIDAGAEPAGNGPAPAVADRPTVSLKARASAPSAPSAPVAEEPESPVAEAPKAEPEAPKANKEDTRRLATLLAAERRAHEKSVAVSKEKAAFESQRAQFKADLEELAALRDLGKNASLQPTKLLEHYKIPFDTLAKSVLADGKPDPEKLVELKVAELRAEFEKREADMQEKQKEAAAKQRAAERAAQSATFSRNIDRYALENTDRFPLLANAEHVRMLTSGDMASGGDAIVQTLQDIFREGYKDETFDFPIGQEPNLDKCMQLVESYLQRKARAFVKADTAATQADSPAGTRTPTVLPNRKASPVAAGVPERDLSPGERMKRAAAKLVWKAKASEPVKPASGRKARKG